MHRTTFGRESSLCQGKGSALFDVLAGPRFDPSSPLACTILNAGRWSYLVGSGDVTRIAPIFSGPIAKRQLWYFGLAVSAGGFELGTFNSDSTWMFDSSR